MPEANRHTGGIASAKRHRYDSPYRNQAQQEEPAARHRPCPRDIGAMVHGPIGSDTRRDLCPHRPSAGAEIANGSGQGDRLSWIGSRIFGYSDLAIHGVVRPGRRKDGGDDSGPTAPPPVVTKEAIQQKLQTVFNAQDAEFNGPQMVFNMVHPIGTASRVAVHDVSLQWKTDKPTADENDIMSWTCRLTVYWNSILVDDGFTKLVLTFDNEVKNFTNVEILATNGKTTEEVNAAAWDIGFQIGLMLAE